MNKREKKLLFATTLVLLFGVAVWLFSGSDKKKAAAASPSQKSAAVVEPEPDTNGAPVVAQPGTAAPPEGIAASSDLFISPLILLEKGLVEVLKVKQAYTAIALPDDPFAAPIQIVPTVSVDSRSPVSTQQSKLPSVTGIYVSGNTMGAIVDGKVCFQGDRIGPFSLSQVNPLGIVLTLGSQRFSVLLKKAEEGPKR